MKLQSGVRRFSSQSFKSLEWEFTRTLTLFCPPGVGATHAKTLPSMVQEPFIIFGWDRRIFLNTNNMVFLTGVRDSLT